MTKETKLSGENINGLVQGKLKRESMGSDSIDSSPTYIKLTCFLYRLKTALN